MTPSYEHTVELVLHSQSRVERSLAGLDDARFVGPSALPGWTRGHVATHLARNADGLRRFVLGVRDGSDSEMYPGGPEARAAAIEEGAGRPADLLVADLTFAGRRLVDDLRAADPARLDTTVKWRKPIAARDIPTLRWRELEIHHVDLDVGYTWSDWPDEFVDATLAVELPALAGVAPDVTVPDLPPAEVLSWLIGRPTRRGLPALPPWPF